eukprot:125842-Alexandrium_andersonii.AAC.1
MRRRACAIFAHEVVAAWNDSLRRAWVWRAGRAARVGGAVRGEPSRCALLRKVTGPAVRRGAP